MSTKFKTTDVLASFPNDNLPIISVGCGMCKREKDMSKTRRIICIDPTTEDKDAWYGISKVMTPDYSSVKELIKEDPSIIGNCHVFLEYPMTDYVTYDFLGIYDLQPRFVVLLTTTTCQSGGLLLHMWLNNNGVKTTNKEKTRTQENMPQLNPNVLKYDLTIDKAYSDYDVDGVKNGRKFIFVSGNRQEADIIERAVLSPTSMEHMGAALFRKNILILEILE